MKLGTTVKVNKGFLKGNVGFVVKIGKIVTVEFPNWSRNTKVSLPKSWLKVTGD